MATETEEQSYLEEVTRRKIDESPVGVGARQAERATAAWEDATIAWAATAAGAELGAFIGASVGAACGPGAPVCVAIVGAAGAIIGGVIGFFASAAGRRTMDRAVDLVTDLVDRDFWARQGRTIQRVAGGVCRAISFGYLCKKKRRRRKPAPLPGGVWPFPRAYDVTLKAMYERQTGYPEIYENGTWRRIPARVIWNPGSLSYLGGPGMVQANADLLYRTIFNQFQKARRWVRVSGQKESADLIMGYALQSVFYFFTLERPGQKTIESWPLWAETMSIFEQDPTGAEPYRRAVAQLQNMQDNAVLRGAVSTLGSL